MQQLWRTLGTVVPVLLICLPLAALGAWGLAAWRSKRVTRRDAWIASLLDAALVLAVLPVLYLVTVPIMGLEGRTMLSLTPGAEIGPLFGGLDGTAARSALLQALGNLALFVPAAALFPLRVKALRSLPRIVLAALLVSSSVEVAQGLLQIGRVSTTDDVILNTLGALLGASVTRRWWRKNSSTIDGERTAVDALELQNRATL